MSSRSSHGRTTRGSSLTVEVFCPGMADPEAEALRDFAGRGGFVMHGNPGFRRFGMAVPGRQFGPMGWRHANFHNFHDGRFHHFHRNFVGFPFFVAGGFPYDDYGY